MTEMTRLDIQPMSPGVEQRVRAVALASTMACGVRMELHSSHTEFFATDSVPVGSVEVYEPPSYKAQPEYVTTLASASEVWPKPEGGKNR